MERAEHVPQPAPANRRLLAPLLSFVFPGMGHIYAGRRERGMWIAITTATLLGLLWWLELWSLLPALVPFWLWNAWETRTIVFGRRPSTVKLVMSAAIIVYAIGWRVTEIDVQQLAVGASKIRPFVVSLLQPYYVDREVTYAASSAPVQVPCGDVPPPTAGATGGTVVVPTPPCASVGESITVRGQGFPPNVEGELWWENPIGDRARLRSGGQFITFLTDAQGTFEVRVTVPDMVPRQFQETAQLHKVEARYISEVGPWRLTETSALVAQRMGETIAQALMATTWGALFAVPLSFFAARNPMQFHPLALLVYYLARTALNILRAIEPLIMAIVFVVWVGLGPFAGVLALTMHSIAALGKLYSEAIESIDPGPIEAITATGANRVQVVWYAVLPQVLPPFVAFTVYRWDINVRMSTIIGFVGGGGIGFLLQQWIRLTDFRSASAAIWAIALVVTVLDFFSRKVRERFV
ncbi:MAG: phosphonate ABC transporter, permease protein PhnE [Ardenticatenia bacterium]|nr:phosphonate ABC transporter, permease protein PhnE [Ardenticatenia bacterium]